MLFQSRMDASKEIEKLKAFALWALGEQEQIKKLIKSLRNYLPLLKETQQSWHVMNYKINLVCSVLCTMGERKKVQKEEKPFPILLLSVPKAGQGIIFVFSDSAQGNNYIESFPLINKYLISRISIEILLEISMHGLMCFWVNVSISRQKVKHIKEMVFQGCVWCHELYVWINAKHWSFSFYVVYATPWTLS